MLELTDKQLTRKEYISITSEICFSSLIFLNWGKAITIMKIGLFFYDTP